MSYIGNPPAEAYTNTVKDSFSGDGSTVAFTLSRPSLTNDVRVVVENVIQDPTVAYSVSGTTLTFTSAPPSGTNNIYVVHLGPAVQTAVPPGEISAATTFASNVTVQGAFTSRGIDDNATSTAMTLASGGAITMTNGLTVDNNGATVLTVDRATSDGAVIDLQRSGTSFGTLGVLSNFPYIGGGDTGMLFVNADDTVRPHNITTNSARDNAIDLGEATVRWRNLYLSGGVYLGGTGAANYLDDYEEGTWTPVPQTGSWTVNYARYTKVGRLVTCSFQVTATVGGTGNDITGLPFTALIASGSGVVGYQSWDADPWTIHVQQSNVSMRKGPTSQTLGNATTAYGIFSYFTA